MSSLPETMRGLAVPKRCGPDGYEIMDLPLPSITHPHQILMRIHAATFQTFDGQRAGEYIPMQKRIDYPFSLGHEGAGVVVAVGSAVTRFKPGDEVYGVNILRPIFSEPDSGYCAEYAVGNERIFLHKPPHLSWEDAGCMMTPTLTTYKPLVQAMAIMGVDSLEGKTVFIPAALSSLGHVAVQLAKNVFGAAKVISTVSTPKMPLVEKLLPGVVDQLIDYNTTRVGDVVPKGSVDLMLNTQWGSLNSGIPLLNPHKGVLMSLASIPSSKAVGEIMGPDNVPFWLGCIFDLAQYWYAFKLRGTKITFDAMSQNPGVREDLEKCGELIAMGKVKSVKRVVGLEDIQRLREECRKVNSGKGGVGRLVVSVIRTQEP